MLSYEDDFCSEDCFEFYKNKTKNLEDFDNLFGEEIKEVQKEYPNYLSHDPDIKAYIINREKTLLADIEKKVCKVKEPSEEATDCNDCNKKYKYLSNYDLGYNDKTKEVIKILKTYV